jgi:hypothetical protein
MVFCGKENFSSIYIPCEDFIRYGFLLKIAIKNNTHFLLCGNSGVGKTKHILELFDKNY